MEFFVHGLFTSEASAARAVQSLIEASFGPDLISALMHKEGEVVLEEAVPVFKTEAARGAALGSAFGMVGGALLAIGGLLAGGPLMVGLAGAASGALAGTLGGLGRWKSEIDFPEHMHPGMILVGVSTEASSVERARTALVSARAERIHVSRKNEACMEVDTEDAFESGALTGS